MKTAIKKAVVLFVVAALVLSIPGEKKSFADGGTCLHPNAGQDNWHPTTGSSTIYERETHPFDVTVYGQTKSFECSVLISKYPGKIYCPDCGEPVMNAYEVTRRHTTEGCPMRGAVVYYEAY